MPRDKTSVGITTNKRFIQPGGGGGGSSTLNDIIDLIKTDTPLFYNSTISSSVNKAIEDSSKDPTNPLVIQMNDLENTINNDVLPDLTDIKTLLNALNTDFNQFKTTTSTDINDLKTSLVTVNTSLTKIINTVDIDLINLKTLKEFIDDNTQRIEDLETNKDLVEQEIIDIKQSIIDLETNINADIDALTLVVNNNKADFDAHVVTYTNKVLEIENKITALETTLNSNLQRITDIEDYLDTKVKIFLDIDNLKLSEIKTAIDTFTTDIATNKTDIINIYTEIGNIKTDIADISTRLLDVENKITAIETDINDIKDAITQLTNDVYVIDTEAEKPTLAPKDKSIVYVKETESTYIFFANLYYKINIFKNYIKDIEIFNLYFLRYTKDDNTTTDIPLYNLLKQTIHFPIIDIDYYVGDVVLFNSKLFIAITNHRYTGTPNVENDTTNWELLYDKETTLNKNSYGDILSIRGVVASTADLPTADNTPGDIYFVGDTTTGTTDLEDYIWVDPAVGVARWERLGSNTGSVLINDSHIGQVYTFNGLFPDSELYGLLPCAGQVVSKADYPELYKYYEVNNPALIFSLTSFKLPNYDSSSIVREKTYSDGVVIDYADGTRILHGYTSMFINASGTHDITFPEPFVSNVYSVVSLLPMDKYTSTIESLAGHIPAFYSSNHRIDKFAVTIQITASASPPYAIRYTIIGKWNTESDSGHNLYKFIKAKNIVKDRQYVVAEPEVGVTYLANSSLIKFQGKLYRCIVESTWTGALTADWEEYSPTPDVSKLIQADGGLSNGKIWKGTKQEYDVLAVKDPNTIYYVEYVGQQNPDNFYNRYYYVPGETYLKDQIVYIKPATYETQDTGVQTYPYTSPANTSYMGISRTYLARTNFRNYDLCLRAKIDNPRDPNIVGSIGTDWAVDNPSAIVEEGSNSNGSYVIYADSKINIVAQKQHTGMVANAFHQVFVSYPLILTVDRFDNPVYKAGNFEAGVVDQIAQNYLAISGKTDAGIPHIAIAVAGTTGGMAIITAYGHL